MHSRNHCIRSSSLLRLVLIGALALGGGLAACGDQASDDSNSPAPAQAESDEADEGTGAAARVSQAHTEGFDVPTLNPRINRCLQIDRLDRESSTPADANLYQGVDPADGTASADEPSECDLEGDFIDWENIDDLDESDDAKFVVGGVFEADNFILPDTISAQGTKDPTAFPFSDERVGEANVLPKQDLVEGSLAYNTDFVYFGLSRQGTNGSSSYFWIFTQEPPHIHPDNENRLIYNITAGDVLFVGDFDPSRGDVLEVFQAQFDQTGITAVDAATPENAIWGPVGDTVVSALNTTITEPGETFHTAEGIPSNRLTKDGDYEPGAFAEGAVDLSVFAGDSTCGAGVFHGTVITRPSRSRSSDLKDLIAPFVLELGNITAEIDVSGDCDGILSYELDSVTGPLGDSIPEDDFDELDCTWTITDPDGTDHTDGPVACDLKREFDIDTEETPAGEYTVSVKVTGSNGFSGCEATDSDAASVGLPLNVHLTPDFDKSCNMSDELTNSTNSGDTMTYYSTVSGGDGDSTNDTYCWLVNNVNISESCTGSEDPTECDLVADDCGIGEVTDDTMCTVDFADSTFCGDIGVELIVDDDNTDDEDPCADQSGTIDFCPDESEDETATKLTTITSTDSCTVDSDCLSGSCTEGTCDTVECVIDAHCDSGFVCDGNLCVAE